MAKRLDVFFLKEDLVERFQAFTQWVGEGGDFDHLPILLKIKGRFEKLGAPFKFNPEWLKEDSYKTLFKGT